MLTYIGRWKKSGIAKDYQELAKDQEDDMKRKAKPVWT